MKAVLDRNFLDAQRHFWRMQYILENGEVPDQGFGIEDDSEVRLIEDQQQEKREERVAEKVKEGEQVDIDDIVSVQQHLELVRICAKHTDDDSDEENVEGTIRNLIKNENDALYLELSEDIYTLGFLLFLKGASGASSTNKRVLDDMVLKCVFTFVLQAMLVSLLMIEYLNVDTSADSFEMGGFFSGVTYGTPSMNLTRIICCFLMHVTLFSEVILASHMLNFAKKVPTDFGDQRFEYAMMFAFFKLVSGLLCFVTNIVVMLRSSTTEDVIKDFVALGVIAQIDDFMYSTVQ